MLNRRFNLKKYFYFLKTTNNLWIPPLIFVNIFLPAVNFVMFKLKGEDAAEGIQNMMYFFIPIFSVWISNFVSKLFFSEKTADALFFYDNKHRLATSLVFYLLSLADCMAVTLLHRYCIEGVFSLAVKLFCISALYYGISSVFLRLSKSVATVNMILIIYTLFNALYSEFVPLICYISYYALTWEMFFKYYLIFLILGAILAAASYLLPSRAKKSS